MVRRNNESAVDLDSMGDLVFARAEKPGTAPEAVLRVFAQANSTTVDQHTVDDEPAGTAIDGLTELKTGFGEHWRLDLGGLLLADSDLDSADRNADVAPGSTVKGVYKGVYGTFYCNNGATDCGALTESTFTNGWYFTPSVVATEGGLYTPMHYGTLSKAFQYEDSDGDGVYEAIHYPDYGIWLTWDSTQGTDPDDGRQTGDLARFGINARAWLIGPEEQSRREIDTETPATPTNQLAASATYRGTARGLSARSQYQGSEYVTTSGHFLADVEMNATFGASATLGGEIDNFRSADPANQGTDHVNSAWSITLLNSSLGNAGQVQGREEQFRIANNLDPKPCLLCEGNPQTGVFDEDNVTGRWTAYGHGDRGKRPIGFFGGFVAAFDDDGIDQNAGADRTSDGTGDPDGNLYDDGAALGVYSVDLVPASQ
ncbi:MAG: hypothetical protein OXC91_10670 [Rhodobacteraceae bacterium]|nr:hypothetical protein [Paracoccaceae bacterium]